MHNNKKTQASSCYPGMCQMKRKLLLRNTPGLSIEECSRFHTGVLTGFCMCNGSVFTSGLAASNSCDSRKATALRSCSEPPAVSGSSVEALVGISIGVLDLCDGDSTITGSYTDMGE